MHIAVRKKELKVIEWLLKNGAKSDVKNSKDRTQLEVAQHFEGQKQGIMQLFQTYSQPNLQIKEGSINHQQPQQKRTRTDSEEEKSEDSNTKRSRTSFQVAEQGPIGRKRAQNGESELGDDQVKKRKTSEEYNASGTKFFLHGDIYQLKLLMILVKRGLDQGYFFDIATDMGAAEKFDDAVFQYQRNNGDETEEKVVSFWQFKHKQDNNKKITVNDLLTEKDGEFSLQKYFISYRKIKQKPEFKDHELKEFVICTNIGLEESLRNSFELVESEDDILKYDNRESKRLRLKLDNFSRKEDLILRLQNASELNRLAKKLAQCVLENKPLDLRDSLFQLYHGALGEKVIDVKSAKQKKEKNDGGKDVKKTYAKFHGSFLDGTLPELESFRSAFLKAYSKMSKESINTDEFWQKMKEKELQISQIFGKVFKLDTNPQLTDPQEFAKAIISDTEQGIVNIKREKGIIKDNIDKLAGHILIKKDDKEKDTYYLSSAFFDDNNKLPGNLEDFKSVLKAELESKSIEFDRDKYKFHISDFKTCKEKQLHLNPSLPDDYIDEEEIERFFEDLVFAVDQPNEVELGEIIKDELGKEFNKIDRKNVYSRFLEKMLDWMKDKKGKFFTHEQGKIFFEGIKKEILGAIYFEVKDPVVLFTGREKELNELHGMIQREGKAVVSHISSVSGLGGIGKTELVRKYIEEYGKDHNWNIMWINAESEKLLRECFFNLAITELEITQPKCTKEDEYFKKTIEGVYKFFANKKSLFIFDNVNDAKHLEQFLPSCVLKPNDNKPDIVITSRVREWESEIEVLELGGLELDDAMAFVKVGLSIEDKSHDEEIKDLVGTLQCFPLAIQQAIAYINDQRVTREFSIDNYLGEYRKKTQDLLDSTVFNGIDNDYEKTTFTTWEITIDEIAKKEHGQLALKILNAITYLAPENIDRGIFLDLAEDDESKLRSAVRLLVKCSMVNGENKQSILSVHRLVQEVLGLKLKNQGKDQEVILSTFKLLKRKHDVSDDTFRDESYTHFIKLLSHMNNLLTKKPEGEEESVEGCFVELSKIILDDYSRDIRSDIEKDTLEKLLPILKKMYPANSPNYHKEVVDMVIRLGEVYEDLVDDNELKELFKEYLSTFKEGYHLNDYRLARVLIVFASTSNNRKEDLLLSLSIIKKYCNDINNHEVAELLLRAILYNISCFDNEERRKLFEWAFPTLLIHYHGQGVIYELVENLETAYNSSYEKQKSFLTQSLDSLKGHCSSFQYLSILENLRKVYENKGYYEIKKELSRRILNENLGCFMPRDLSKKKVKEKRNIDTSCIDSRDEEEITKEEKEQRIKDLFNADKVVEKVKNIEFYDQLFKVSQKISKGEIIDKNVEEAFVAKIKGINLGSIDPEIRYIVKEMKDNIENKEEVKNILRRSRVAEKIGKVAEGAGLAFTAFLVGKHIANGDIEGLGYDALNLWVIPKIGEKISGKMLELGTKLDSQMLKEFAPVMGRAIGNFAAFLGLAESIKARQSATDSADIRIADLNIATNSIFIAADVPAVVTETMSVAGLETGVVGEFAGPVGVAISVAVIIIAQFVEAGLEVEKLEEHIKLTGQEKHDLYWDFFLDKKVPDYIEHDMEAEEIYKQYISRILDQFKSNYDTIAISLPSILVTKEEYANSIYFRNKRGAPNLPLTFHMMPSFLYERIKCISQTKTVGYGLDFNLDTNITRSLYTDTMNYYSRIVPNTVENYSVVCGPHSDNITIQEKSRKNLDILPKNELCGYMSRYRGKILSEVVEQWSLQKYPSNCYNAVIYRNTNSRGYGIIYYIPAQNANINVVFQEKDILNGDRDRRDKIENRYYFEKSLDSCKVYSPGKNFFYIAGKFSCDLGADGQKNIVITQGNLTTYSINIHSIIGSNRTNYLEFFNVDYVDGKGSNDVITVKNFTTIKGYFGDSIYGKGLVLLPINFSNIDKVTHSNNRINIYNKSGAFISVDKQTSVKTADGLFVTPTKIDGKNGVVTNLHVTKSISGDVVLDDELDNLRKIDNSNFNITKQLSSANYHSTIGSFSNHIFYPDKEHHNFYWEAPSNISHLYLFDNRNANITIAQANGILDFSQLNCTLDDMPFTENNAGEIKINKSGLHVTLLPDYKDVTVTFDGQEYYKLQNGELERDYCSHSLKIDGRFSVNGTDLLNHHNCFTFDSDKVLFLKLNNDLLLLSDRGALSISDYYSSVHKNWDLSVGLNNRIIEPEEFRERADDFSSFRYYQPDEQGLQIYHNQPINKNDIGLVDLKDKPILDFDMKVMNDTLLLSHKNNTLVKVENWNTYQTAREMMFAFNDTIVSNSKCIASICNSEDVVVDFNRVAEKIKLKLKLNKQLFDAVKQGNFNETVDLVNQGADVNATDENAWTLLHWAYYALHWDIGQYLMGKGSNANAKNSDGKTPLGLSVVQYSEVKLRKNGEVPLQRKRRHHHGGHDRYHVHLSSNLLAIDSSDQTEIVASSGTRQSSWINGLFFWVKSSVNGLVCAVVRIKKYLAELSGVQNKWPRGEQLTLTRKGRRTRACM